jgi:hypothetical protein
LVERVIPPENNESVHGVTNTLRAGLVIHARNIS